MRVQSKAFSGKAVQDVRSPQNVGAVLGMLCKLPIKERVKICWLLLWGPKVKRA
jgi:hypothetical protein